MKPQIILIGAGNIGSRHLQALALLDRPAQVYVVEPSEEARVLSKSRFESVYDHTQDIDVSYFADMSGLPAQADIAIIATSSLMRRAIVEELCSRVRIPNIILEKVAFQSVRDLYEMQMFFSTNQIKAWVDCPNRDIPFYQQMREKICHDRKLNILSDGGEWGIGCNSIHELDLYAYLAGKELAFQADISDLDPEIIPSKRSRYVEFTGELRLNSTKGRLTLRANRGMEVPIYRIVATDQRQYLIDEANNYVRFREAESQWNWQESELGDHLLVSQMTQGNVEQILDTGTCPLATFEESSVYHEVLLNALLAHYNKVREEERTACPIT